MVYSIYSVCIYVFSVPKVHFCFSVISEFSEKLLYDEEKGSFELFINEESYNQGKDNSIQLRVIKHVMNRCII